MRTIYFNNSPKITLTSSICGPKESKSKIADFVDIKLKDDMINVKSFEKAETKMLYMCIENLLKKSNENDKIYDAIISGDLLNQIVASTFSIRNFNTGFLGVYNACATFTESLLLGATLIDGNYLNKVICSTSSHFSSVERQYRYPLELGSTRPPLSQWTVTGAGACVLSKSSDGIKITSGTVGKIIDYGVTDANNMGAAMAPSAVDTLCTHFIETGKKPSDYDLIITGDLGTFGSRIFKDLMWEKGYDIEKQHIDCGELIFNINEKEYQGGSGAGCSSLVFCSYIYKLMKQRKLNKVLLMSTGALLSTLSSQQGETIPCIAHAVALES